METRIRTSLEIPTQKHKGNQTDTNTTAEKSFQLVINLWVFRLEYTKEHSKS